VRSSEPSADRDGSRGLRAVFADGSRAYQVVAFAKPETFEKIGDEITGIVKSFHARCDGR
jgi:hypothetical protein